MNDAYEVNLVALGILGIIIANETIHLPAFGFLVKAAEPSAKEVWKATETLQCRQDFQTAVAWKVIELFKQHNLNKRNGDNSCQKNPM